MTVPAKPQTSYFPAQALPTFAGTAPGGVSIWRPAKVIYAYWFEVLNIREEDKVYEVEYRGTGGPMEKEFEEWYLANQDHFKTYSAQEIADIGEAVGFEKRMIYQWLLSSKFVTVA